MKRMKMDEINVYAVKASGNYGGGMAVVAAEGADQAKVVAGTIRDSMWHTDYASPDSIELLPCKFYGKPCVLSHFETGE